MIAGEINVTLQLFGSMLSFMIILCLIFSGNSKTKTDRLYVLLLILNMGGLLFDALAYMFRGKVYPFAYFGVRASNFLAFCSLCVFTTAFLSYLNQFVSVKKPGACRPYLRISGCVCAVYLALYIINLFVPIFYRIDEYNIYTRAPLYGLTMLPAFLNIILTVIILIKYRDTLTKSQINVFGLYVLLPVISLPIQIFVYGLNFTSITTTLVVIIMFLFVQTKQANIIAVCADAFEESEEFESLIQQIKPKFTTIGATEEFNSAVGVDNVQGYPTTIFVDKDANAVGMMVGVPCDGSEIDESVNKNYMKLVNEALEKVNE